MYKLTVLIACFLLAALCVVGMANEQAQFIILKADDFRFDDSNEIPQTWQTFIDYIENRNLKAGIGIIGDSFQWGTEEAFSLVRDYHNQGNIEFFNHGYSHYYNNDPDNPVWEFRNTLYKQQYEHLMLTQQLSQTQLGITMRSFSAPYNATDANTILALDDVNDLKIWLCGKPGSEKLNISDFCLVEYSVGDPYYSLFLITYDPQAQYLIIQIHPAQWNSYFYGQFDQIIDYLLQENVTFVTPLEYYNLLHPLQADLNSDKIVDSEDFAVLAGQWLQPPGLPSADIADVPDGIVDSLDLAVLVNSWLAESL